jgi:predicted metal-binding protein
MGNESDAVFQKLMVAEYVREILVCHSCRSNDPDLEQRPQHALCLRTRVQSRDQVWINVTNANESRSRVTRIGANY